MRGFVTSRVDRQALPGATVLLHRKGEMAAGTAADGNLDGLLNEDSVRYVQKPYRAAELAKHVAELIALGKERERAKRATEMHHPS